MRTFTPQESKLALPISGITLLDERDWIATLENGLAIMKVFTGANPCLTANQIGELCGVRTHAHRCRPLFTDATALGLHRQRRQTFFANATHFATRPVSS